MILKINGCPAHIESRRDEIIIESVFKKSCKP